MVEYLHITCSNAWFILDIYLLIKRSLHCAFKYAQQVRKMCMCISPVIIGLFFFPVIIQLFKTRKGIWLSVSPVLTSILLIQNAFPLKYPDLLSSNGWKWDDLLHFFFFILTFQRCLPWWKEAEPVRREKEQQSAFCHFNRWLTVGLCD